MRHIKQGSLAALLLAMGLAAVAAPTSGQSPDSKISARSITYADLGRLVRGYKGKVVVVDFWSVY